MDPSEKSFPQFYEFFFYKSNLLKLIFKNRIWISSPSKNRLYPQSCLPVCCRGIHIQIFQIFLPDSRLRRVWLVQTSFYPAPSTFRLQQPVQQYCYSTQLALPHLLTKMYKVPYKQRKPHFFQILIFFIKKLSPPAPLPHLIFFPRALISKGCNFFPFPFFPRYILHHSHDIPFSS